MTGPICANLTNRLWWPGVCPGVLSMTPVTSSNTSLSCDRGSTLPPPLIQVETSCGLSPAGGLGLVNASQSPLPMSRVAFGSKFARPILYDTGSVSHGACLNCLRSLSAELGDPFGLLQDDAGIVLSGRARWLTVIEDARVRPVGYPQAAVAAFGITHDVAPFGAVHVTVSEGKWGIDGVGQAIVASAEDMPDFVGDGNGDGGAGIMYHEIGVFRVGCDAR